MYKYKWENITIKNSSQGQISLKNKHFCEVAEAKKKYLLLHKSTLLKNTVEENKFQSTS